MWNPKRINEICIREYQETKKSNHRLMIGGILTASMIIFILSILLVI